MVAGGRQIHRFWTSSAGQAIGSTSLAWRGCRFRARLVLLAISVSLLLANLIAAGSGRATARVRPALGLRSET